MNIALILAGGVDSRFQMNVPKQFVNVYNRPIIVYTLQVFQSHPEIDEIIVVCLDGWQEMVKAYGKQFQITKLKAIISGGENGQISAQNGIMYLKDKICQEDIVVVHDSIRPLVSHQIITDSIRVCRVHGMGVAAVTTMDTVMKTADGIVGRETISRYSIVRVQTPQAYQMKKVLQIYEKAMEARINGEVDINSVASKVGEEIFFSRGSDLNLKINTIEDVEIFKALYEMQHSSNRKNTEDGETL